MRKECKKSMGCGNSSILCIIYISGKTGMKDGVEVISEKMEACNFLKQHYQEAS